MGLAPGDFGERNVLGGADLRLPPPKPEPEPPPSWSASKPLRHYRLERNISGGYYWHLEGTDYIVVNLKDAVLPGLVDFELSGFEGSGDSRMYRALLEQAGEYGKLARTEKLEGIVLTAGILAAAAGGPEFAVERGLGTAAKGELGESAAVRTLARAKYEKLTARLSSNTGFDGVFVSQGRGGIIEDIIVTESKYSSSGRASLSPTATKGKQLSSEWIDATIMSMLQSPDDAVRRTGRLLDANRSLIRPKANVLDASGFNRWNRIRIPE